MTTKTKRSGLTILALAVAIAAMPALARIAGAQDDAPMDHAAMAASYQAEAKEAQAKAAMHQTMLNRYKNAPVLPKGTAFPKEAMTKHCQKLVDSYTQAAKDASDLAKMHQEAAAQAGN